MRQLRNKGTESLHLFLSHKIGLWGCLFLLFLSGCSATLLDNTAFIGPSSLPAPLKIVVNRQSGTAPLPAKNQAIPIAKTTESVALSPLASASPSQTSPTPSPSPSSHSTTSSSPVILLPSPTSPSLSVGPSGGATTGPMPPPQPTAPPPGLRIITGVFIQGQNIMGAFAPAALHANYLGKVIQLSIQGYFYLGAAQPEDVDVYLDNDIETNTLSVSNNRIEASFNTANIPDLYLVGSSHTLTLDLPDQTLKVEIRVGTPEVTVSLAPQIQEIEVVRDEFDEVEYIQIKGTNLMYNSNFAQVKVNQEVVSILQAGLEENEQEQEEFIMLIDPPQNSELTKNTRHNFSYTTPFGVAFQEFVAN